MFDLPPLPLESKTGVKGKGKAKTRRGGGGAFGTFGGFGGRGAAAATVQKAAAASLDDDLAAALGDDVITIYSSSDGGSDYEMSGTLPPQFLSLANVDVNSDDFNSLPLELQHEIVVDLQEGHALRKQDCRLRILLVARGLTFR